MQVEWLTAAEDDLREIARRVALKFGYATAEQTVASVTEETQRLADFPEIGRLCNEYEGSRRVYRALNTRYDCIVYTVTCKSYDVHTAFSHNFFQGFYLVHRS